MEPITIIYPFRPARRSLAGAEVADLFGITDDEPPYVVARDVILDIRPRDVVLFTGPSGSGKSSLLREAGRRLDALDIHTLELPGRAAIDCLSGSVPQRLDLLAACGLSEARLLLRTPAEMSDGQRSRFRLALALDRVRRLGCSPFLMIDEFAAVLDRTLAKVLAFNVRKLATRTAIGFLLATTHNDVLDDLNPDVHVVCHGDGVIDVDRWELKKKALSFAHEFWMSDGARSDWPYFARWHYRSHSLAFVKRIVLLWHNSTAVGICVFSSPAASLRLRSRFFGLTHPRSEHALSAMNRQLWLLSRVVLHPTYRGAGVAAAFVRRACETCPVPWIETLTAMGRANPFFERAGFTRVGVIRKEGHGRASGAYGRQVSAETEAKSRHSEPVYYVFDRSAKR